MKSDDSKSEITDENSESEVKDVEPPRIKGIFVPEWKKSDDPNNWKFIKLKKIFPYLNTLDPTTLLSSIPNGFKLPSRHPIDCTDNYNRYLNGKEADYNDDYPDERSTHNYRVSESFDLAKMRQSKLGMSSLRRPKVTMQVDEIEK